MEQEEKADDDTPDFIERSVREWVIYPVIVIVCAIVAIGLIISLLGLQNVPQWVYTLPGVPAAVIYYGIKIMGLWDTMFRPGSGPMTNFDVHVEQQRTDRGSIAPVIGGRGNHTTIHMQTPAEAAPVPDAPFQKEHEPHAGALGGSGPTTDLPEAPKALKTGPGAIPLLTEEIIVEGAAHEARQFDLEKGDRLEGIIRSDAPMDIFVMTEDDYVDYWENGDPGQSYIWMLDETSSRVRWRARKTATWYVVFDTFRKQNPRFVDIVLRKIPKNGP